MKSHIGKKENGSDFAIENEKLLKRRKTANKLGEESKKEKRAEKGKTT